MENMLSCVCHTYKNIIPIGLQIPIHIPQSILIVVLFNCTIRIDKEVIKSILAGNLH